MGGLRENQGHEGGDGSGQTMRGRDPRTTIHSYRPRLLLVLSPAQDGMTALIHAVKGDAAGVVSQLIDKGASLDVHGDSVRRWAGTCASAEMGDAWAPVYYVLCGCCAGMRAARMA